MGDASKKQNQFHQSDIHSITSLCILFSLEILIDSLFDCSPLNADKEENWWIDFYCVARRMND